MSKVIVYFNLFLNKHKELQIQIRTSSRLSNIKQSETFDNQFHIFHNSINIIPYIH